MIEELKQRSNNECELCKSTQDLDVFEVYPHDGTAKTAILACGKCRENLADIRNGDKNHWHCLNESMWSSEPAVQVVAYRILDTLKDEAWVSNLLDMLYLEPEVLEWAKEQEDNEQNSVDTKDSNGTLLKSGDSVMIIKDLEVKGAGFTAKRGTVVKNILLTSNPKQIEGRVNGVKIVLLTKFLKKV